MLSRSLRKLLRLVQAESATLAARVLGIESVVRRLERASSSVALILLRRFGACLGERVSFAGGITIENATGDRDSRGDFSGLRIGEKCYVGRAVSLDLADEIEIGDEVVLSSEVMILTHSDCGERAMSRWYPRRRAPVRVGHGTWIGARAIVLPGVELGECCVVGAGAVVTRSFPPFSVIGGVPARLLKTLESIPEKAT